METPEVMALIQTNHGHALDIVPNPATPLFMINGEIVAPGVIRHNALHRLTAAALRPVAIAFRDAAPSGVPRIERPEPAGCGYWRLAAEGNLFYTEAPDHYSCPVGAHTHGVELPPDTAKDLNAIVQTMVGLQYIKPEEIPTIPRRQGAFGVAVYAPLADAPFDPDVVLVRGTVKQLMLLAEAAQAAGVAGGGATMGRPTCSYIYSKAPILPRV